MDLTNKLYEKQEKYCTHVVANIINMNSFQSDFVG